MLFRIALLPSAAAASSPSPVSVDRPDISRDDWAVEQMGGTVVNFSRDQLEVLGPHGCTLWWKQKLHAPLVITYEATVLSGGGAFDRVSDLNCFFMARDPLAPDGCPFAPGFRRTGKFEDYDALSLYYVGLGGNNNTTTRFRRYLGNGEKPLLPEHDRTTRDVLLRPNHPYEIRLVVTVEGEVEYWRDGERIFSYRDPAPLREGWFAFRVTQNHVIFKKLQIQSAAVLRRSSR